MKIKKIGKVKLTKTGTATVKDEIITLFILCVLYQFLLHAYFSLAATDPRVLIPHGIAFLHDMALLGIATAIGYFAIAVSPTGFKPAAAKAGLIFIAIVEMLLACYPKILREYLAFPVNLFESDLGSAKTLISDYLGITALLPALIVLLLFVSVLWIPISLRLSNQLKWAGLIIIFSIFALTLKRPSPQPIVFSLQKKIESLAKNETRVVPSLTRSFSASTKVTAQNALAFSTKDIAKYKHIVLIVLEGVTSKDFETEFLMLPNGYYQQHKSHAVYYQNYYTTNLDSYTSLISMITSVQVPYRAYADTDIYEQVNTASSLTEDLHHRGFHSIFISTYEYQPFVPTRRYWNKIYERADIPSLNNWLSLGSNRMESATEDKAALSTIIENIKSHDKTFVLHELVYGHSPEWKAKTGKSQLSYYNEYLIDLSERLKKENRLSQTLLVIVSDHGDRAKSSNADNYRIPLLIVGDSIASQNKTDLLTHIQLPEVIYHYAALDKQPTSPEEILFVGSTEKWVYGKMNKQNDYLFIDDASGTILSQKGGFAPMAVRNEFQNHLDSFNDKYGVK